MNNRNDTPFGVADFTRDGVICFGKHKGLHVYELPEDFIAHLLAHYRFNIAVLLNHRNKPTT